MLITRREFSRLLHPEIKQLADDPLGIFLFGLEVLAVVEIVVKKFFRLTALRFDLRAKASKAMRVRS